MDDHFHLKEVWSTNPCQSGFNPNLLRLQPEYLCQDVMANHRIVAGHWKGLSIASSTGPNPDLTWLVCRVLLLRIALWFRPGLFLLLEATLVCLLLCPSSCLGLLPASASVKKWKVEDISPPNLKPVDPLRSSYRPSQHLPCGGYHDVFPHKGRRVCLLCDDEDYGPSTCTWNPISSQMRRQLTLGL